MRMMFELGGFLGLAIMLKEAVTRLIEDVRYEKEFVPDWGQGQKRARLAEHATRYGGQPRTPISREAFAQLHRAVLQGKLTSAQAVVLLRI